MPSLDVEASIVSNENSNDEAPSLSGPIIGIIYPPPEVRSILLHILHISYLIFYYSSKYNIQNSF